MKPALAALALVSASNGVDAHTLRGSKPPRADSSVRDRIPLPNILVFLVDDLGWNQVGYHANPENMEISTPSIDKHALEGIQVDRGYATPWCGPSRAAFQAGTLAAYNENATQAVWSFAPETGFVGGLPPEITTLPKALKKYAQSIGEDYATSYSGKWGLQGATWTNSPMGLGYDEVRAYPEHSTDACDGMLSFGCRGPPGNGGGTLARSLPMYWDQGAEIESDLCDYFRTLDQLTDEEKDIACHSQPRTPPKLIDEDLLDYTKSRILNHDFSEKPLFHFHSTQLMHSPIAYPLKYNEGHPNVELPDYFKAGAQKPPANNNDMRLSAANAMRFIDDIFDETMQALKDVGQWENTIVLFSSDNGGAIFPQSINNNFPLRGGKRSIFDGGYRVVQFLTGGWINQAPDLSAVEVNTFKNKAPFTGEVVSTKRIVGPKATGETQKPWQKETGRKTETFVFIQDWAPTFLEMAGGSNAVDKLYKKEYDSDGNLDPMEGNPMWEYIQNSLSSQGPKQLPRKVSYNDALFYDVTEEATQKLMVTPEELSVFYIRKWNATWPNDADLTPDFGYVSVMPCRPEGHDKPQECCRFNISNDPGEDQPEIMDNVTCDGYKDEALSLYLGDRTTPKTSVAKSCDKPDGQHWKYPTIGCELWSNGETRFGQAKDAYGEYDADKYSLWTQYGAAGPWISYNKETGVAKPVEHYATKCVCETIDLDISQSEVDAYLPTISSPSICISLEKTKFAYDSNFAVPCKGFQRTPKALGLQEYGYHGVNFTYMKRLADLERAGHMGGLDPLTSTALYRSLASYVNREGFTEWPAASKWPYVTPGWNTCQRKNATAMPIGVASSSPWSQSSGDGGDRFRNPNMCQNWNETHSWCPSVCNPLQKGVKEYDILGDWVKLDDGTFFYPIPKDECKTKCAKNPATTAYIGKQNWGMAYHEPEYSNLASE